MSSTNEIFLTTEPMRRYFRWLGLFPCTHPSTTDRQYNFYWAKWQPLSAFHTVLMSFYLCYSTFVDVIAFLPNEMEKYVLFTICLQLLTGAFINIACLIKNSKQWTNFFGRWSSIDLMLSASSPPVNVNGIRRLSRLMFIGFTIYMSSLICLTLTLGFLMFVLPSVMSVTYVRPTYILAIFVYSFHWSISLLLPEQFCLFLMVAISSRLKTTTEQLQVTFASVDDDESNLLDRMEIGDDVERLRIVYQLLLDTVNDIRQVLGPVLVTTCILHSLPLPLLVYSFVKQGQSDSFHKIFKVIAFVTSFIRVAITCFVSQNVTDKVKRVYEVLRDAPSKALSVRSNEEITFFMNSTRVSTGKMSAWGFLDIGTDYLQSVVGLMIAYTITIMQFEMSACPHQLQLNDTSLSIN